MNLVDGQWPAAPNPFGLLMTVPMDESMNQHEQRVLLCPMHYFLCLTGLSSTMISFFLGEELNVEILNLLNVEWF